MNPNIAVLLGQLKKPSDEEYIEAISKAGGNPIVFRPGDNFAPDHLIETDGLLLTGGGDVHPKFYGEKKEDFCDEPDEQRDHFEFQTIQDFLSSKKPILAICRGIQILNVALKGTLYQDLETQIKEGLHLSHKNQNHLTREEKRRVRHQVKIRPDSLLSRCCGEEIEVNSRHHQAVKELAPNLIVTALSEDGIIEGVEYQKSQWIVGVQWHPEAREILSNFLLIFKGFTDTCKKNKL
ncbi:MAG: gamma-glutamyl-gamma-aminobutyrate hydrolase family protein [Candidatus Eremiobacteraeota bacterium]|nr:gamma-glutamyl-gamma-aminobutyrate hydrolase family protein [Candidatus Eremiobacteraeota bacterium]MCL5054449.1 gamma-glutamyl-gamma-aminobutyrate hydrolase family protein [Bacillota bacterium]